LNKVIIFVHKKYSRRLVNLWLSHCSHLDYFNNVFMYFLGQQVSITIEAFGSSSQI